MKIEYVIEKVKEEPRLQDIIDCLYNNKDFKLKKLKSLDNENIKIAFHIIYNVFPENPFENKKE